MTPCVTRCAFTPVHPDLANAAGVSAQLANEKYVESLARIVYYWGYPAVDTFGRTSTWQLMNEPGATMGLFPGAPKNRMGYLDDYIPASQRKVVTPNNDTIYGVRFADLADDSVVIQTPTEVPEGHYWTIQIVDLFTTVRYQLGSASGTLGGKLLLVGPDWTGEKPAGFIDLLHSPTNVAAVLGRSFAARTPEAKARARDVLNQIGMVPLSQDKPGRLTFDCAASARNKVFPAGLTEQMVAADPDLLRVRPVGVTTFWDDLEEALEFNPVVGADDAPMADQARTLLALRKADPAWKALIDHAALEADAELHDGAKYHQVGVDVGNGWQRQENAGLWGTDWFGRAGSSDLYLRQRLSRSAVLHPRHRCAKRVAFWPVPLHHDFPAWRVATGGRGEGRLLVADHVRPGLLHAGRQPQRQTQHRHRESRRGRADVRRGRVADAAFVAQTTQRDSGARQLAPCTGRTIRAHRARLRTDRAAARHHVQAAERATAMK